jgi:hypothetical protein
MDVDLVVEDCIKQNVDEAVPARSRCCAFTDYYRSNKGAVMRKMWALTALAACVVALVSVQGQQKMSKKPMLTPRDYAEIQMLYSRYDHGFDSAPDRGLVLQGGRTIEGQEALAKMAARDGSKPYHIRHIGANALVEPSAPQGWQTFY